MKVGVVVFPGTNCDHDVLHLFGSLGAQTVPIWHRSQDLEGVDLVVLPGGFAYGDYLRTGALAKLSPVMKAVAEFAKGGGRVLGICNGFQILCEAQLLPGVLLENVGRRFLSRFVHLRVEKNASFFSHGVDPGSVITCPIAHFQGNFFATPDILNEIESNRQVVVRYSAADGTVNPEDRGTNVNGSLSAIAGITNREGNVVGLMPHPERAAEQLVGYIGQDSGRDLFAHLAAA